MPTSGSSSRSRRSRRGCGRIRFPLSTAIAPSSRNCVPVMSDRTACGGPIPAARAASADSATFRQDFEPGAENLTVIAAMLPGAAFIGVEEARRRVRYAVLAGLNAEGYVPDDSEHMGLLHARRCQRLTGCEIELGALLATDNPPPQTWDAALKNVDGQPAPALAGPGAAAADGHSLRDAERPERSARTGAAGRPQRHGPRAATRRRAVDRRHGGRPALAERDRDPARRRRAGQGAPAHHRALQVR